MPRKTIFILFLILPAFMQAQDTLPFHRDVKYLESVLRKTPSFKDQIDSVGPAKFDSLVARLMRLNPVPGSFEEFYAISQLIVAFRDNHISFSQNITESGNNMASHHPSAAVPKRAAGLLPPVRLNLDSLRRQLIKKNADNVEGVYESHGTEIGLFRTHTPDSLVGVVLKTSIAFWQPGDVAMILREFKPMRFRAYHADFTHRTFALLKHERYANQMLTESRWPKAAAANKPKHALLTGRPFQFRQLTDSVQYLRLGNFATSSINIEEINRFYDSVKPLLRPPFLIVDLRNNGGGGFRASGHFLRLLGSYTEKAKIFALINVRSFSNAEQFAIRLRSFPNVVLVGQTTNGTITYGSNLGHTDTFPGGRFRVYLTDMTDGGRFLPYEEQGVHPDIFLTDDMDWIEQTLLHIRRPRANKVKNR